MKAHFVGGVMMALMLVMEPGLAKAEGSPPLEPAPAGAEVQRAKLVGALRTDARTKLAATSQALLGKMKTKGATFAPEAATREALVSAGYLGYVTRLPNDIDALVFVVLLEASKDAEEDLRAEMERVSEINRNKKAVRDAIEQCKRESACLKGAKAPAGTTKATFDKLVGIELEGGLDRLAETTQMRIQVVRERRLSVHQSLSSMLKKFGDTAGAIVANMK